MAESKKDFHVVEIPAVHEEQGSEGLVAVVSAIQQHPFMEISQSPGHLLLLKLWQREEDLFGRRIAIKETKMDTCRRQIFQLCSFFVLFHAFFLTILFASSSESAGGSRDDRKWWIPSILSGSTSVVMACLVQVEVFRYWKAWGQLQRERSESRALARGIQELRMKGASFDLSKDPLGGGKRMKSSSVEIKWKPITVFSQNLITIALVFFSGLLFPAPRLILCSS